MVHTVSQIESRTQAGVRRAHAQASDNDYKSLTIALITGLAIEAVIIAAALHAPRTQPQPEKPRPVMEASIVAPKPPPPPPPPPVINKIVKHLMPRTPPKPAPPRVAPPPVRQAMPHTDAPPVVAAPAPAPTQTTAVSPSPAPAPGPAAHGSSAPADVAIECPVQTKPEVPPKAVAEGIVGRVVARATIRAGRVVNVDIVQSQPPRVFDESVRRAMLRYQCRTNGDDAVAVEQTFDFSNAD